MSAAHPYRDTGGHYLPPFTVDSPATGATITVHALEARTYIPGRLTGLLTDDGVVLVYPAANVR